MSGSKGSPWGKATIFVALLVVLVLGGCAHVFQSLQPQPCLKFHGKEVVETPAEEFLVSDRFKAGTPSKDLEIYWVGDNFKSWFGDLIVKSSGGSVELRRYIMIRPAKDASIITELGGEVKVETSLLAIYALMEKQGKGQEGVLLTDGLFNFFFVRDISAILRVVTVGWGNGGWHINAFSAKSRHKLGGVDYPYQVFSSNSGN
ncbi:MAG: hypothetical protein Q8P32_03435 [Candidatus Komeilibacteria bacterium]|nr:hypothetical protein [Candidatus Komeilibacteria bacterium]